MTDDLDALRVEMANERLEHDRAIEIVTDRLDRLEQWVAALVSVIDAMRVLLHSHADSAEGER